MNKKLKNKIDELTKRQITSILNKMGLNTKLIDFSDFDKEEKEEFYTQARNLLKGEQCLLEFFNEWWLEELEDVKSNMFFIMFNEIEKKTKGV